jgi:hypothetical protein
VAHIWIGNDTACKNWSTGGIARKQAYLHSANPLHISPSGVKTKLPTCQNCIRNIEMGIVSVPRGKVPLPDFGVRND